LRVGVVTGHIPISSIPAELNSDRILKKVKVIHHSLQQDFGISSPKIAVLGLNPHAGDNGLIGKDEKTIILPAIDAARNEGIDVRGPLPADGLFGSSGYKEFHAILGMYHDQGLIPFKALSFGSGVNFTAGLPFVRTSPDHGTAFDIAGKGVADESSFREALTAAVDIVRKRRALGS
ncbi:MAG: 4-hydroxythreonine-4-phosphate dehydrogenase PdxA, partial [Flavobacteriales bacterium]|nr:4-hydroxythreonine-4-phosphate dehydrogenase PdxA [Flavobacteriales bacterium]